MVVKVVHAVLFGFNMFGEGQTSSLLGDVCQKPFLTMTITSLRFSKDAQARTLICADNFTSIVSTSTMTIMFVIAVFHYLYSYYCHIIVIIPRY